MNYIERSLKEKTKNISFIQIKEGSKLEGRNLDISNIPLPILLNSLIEEVKSKKGEEINFAKLVEGIIYLLGIGDSDFPNIGKYKEILKTIIPNIEEKLMFDSINKFKNDDIQESLIYIRSLINLNPKHTRALFQYGIVLETIAKGMLEETEVKDAEEVLKLSTSVFEDILDIDEEDPLAYYKLGYHYKYFSQYIKANLIWEKFLKFSKDDLLKEEIREEIATIKDEVNFETAITYLTYDDYSKALDSLLKLLPTHEESWNVNYLIGKAYNGMGEIDQAIEFLNEAIKYNDEETDIYNELGVLYYNVGNISKAIDTFTEGLKGANLDYKLIFNRSLMYSALEEYENALKDAEAAYELNEDDNIRTQIKWLKEKIRDN